jgi:hypothetical protein
MVGGITFKISFALADSRDYEPGKMSQLLHSSPHLKD